LGSEEGNSRKEDSTDGKEKSHSTSYRQMRPPSMTSKKFKKRAALEQHLK